MRLINVDTRELHEFQGNDIPKYAILSHTWADGEVSLQDLQAGRGPSKQGYDKIIHTCTRAKADSLQWVWVDTCCIDKTSSVELSEAINSMYRWYKNSDICYAYLSDVDNTFPYASPIEYINERQVPRWFTRVWTLQELIAPPEVIFYNGEWGKIGCRNDVHMAEYISSVTRIPAEIMQGLKHPYEYSVAQKMSWASHRSYTRTEDVAYSLMGLFEINMPLLYGEGDKAFVRLQEEILKETDDHSLFCWAVPKSSPRAWTLGSVFAKSPDDFEGSGSIVRSLGESAHPSMMTNMGLQIHLSLTELPDHHLRNSYGSIYGATLDAVEHDAPSKVVSITLVPVGVNKYGRVATPALGYAMGGSDNKLIYICKNLPTCEERDQRDQFRLGGIHTLHEATPAAQYPEVYPSPAPALSAFPRISQSTLGRYALALTQLWPPRKSCTQ